MTQLHLPLTESGRKVIIPTTLPVLFLAGPIRNAPKWQDALIKELFPKQESIFIASPTRELSKEMMIHTEPDKDDYQTVKRQRAWEQYYMNQASESGCILFWLPEEASPKEHPEKIYAHITMMELGLWIARKKLNPNLNIVIGTDKKFPEWSTIKFELDTEVPSIPISYSITETIENALELIK